MRLEKLELSNFYMFNGKQEIKFSEDSKMTIIEGQNGSGKTMLVKAMKVALGLEKQSEEHEKPQLECNFDSTIINNENEFLFFQDGERLQIFADEDFLKLKMDPEVFENFFVNVRILFLNSIDKKGLDITHNAEKIMMIESGTDISHSPAKGDQMILSCCMLIALKKILFPNSFLVLDSPFHNISQEYKEKLCHVLLEHSSQVIIFVTDAEYRTTVQIDADTELLSVKNIIKNLNPAVSEYRLVTNEDQTKIENCL